MKIFLNPKFFIRPCDIKLIFSIYLYYLFDLLIYYAHPVIYGIEVSWIFPLRSIVPKSLSTRCCFGCSTTTQTKYMVRFCPLQQSLKECIRLGSATPDLERPFRKWNFVEQISSKPLRPSFSNHRNTWPWLSCIVLTPKLYSHNRQHKSVWMAMTGFFSKSKVNTKCLFIAFKWRACIFALDRAFLGFPLQCCLLDYLLLLFNKESI